MQGIPRGIRCAVYDKVVANPTITNIEEARTLYLESGTKAIIAFGGGSAMDCAKVTGACIVKPNKPIHKMKGLLRICKKLPLLIAVLTTAGTGSETTLAAVITDSGAKHKYPINDFFDSQICGIGLPRDPRSAQKYHSHNGHGCTDPCGGDVYR